jgi:hypothetical protein
MLGLCYFRAMSGVHQGYVRGVSGVHYRCIGSVLWYLRGKSGMSQGYIRQGYIRDGSGVYQGNNPPPGPAFSSNFPVARAARGKSAAPAAAAESPARSTAERRDVAAQIGFESKSRKRFITGCSCKR